MNFRNRIAYILILALLLPVCGAANEISGRLPSEETAAQITDMTSMDNQGNLRDWWGDGPPTEGGGGGGAVGMPIGDGLLPLGLAGLLYISFAIYRKRRKVKLINF